MALRIPAHIFILILGYELYPWSAAFIADDSGKWRQRKEAPGGLKRRLGAITFLGRLNDSTCYMCLIKARCRRKNN
jgi:hypothetical protein